MSRARSKDSKPLKVHLVTNDMKGIGCGTKADKYIVPTSVEIDNLAACVKGTGLEVCLRCFKYFTWASGTAAGGAPQSEEKDSDVDSDSNSSDSDTSNDTASEQEALKITGLDEEAMEIQDEDV